MDTTSVAAKPSVDRARIDVWLGRILGALLIAILLAAPLTFGALRDQDFFWVQVLGVLAATLWVIRLWLNPAPIFLPPIVWPLLLFCIYAIARYFTSDVEYLARKEVVRVLFYMMFFVLALNHFKDAKAADVAVYVLMVLGMALSVYALRQYLTGTNVVWHLVRPGYAYRGSGTFIYPNHYAAWAEMLLATGLGYVFLGRISTWGRVLLGYCCLWIGLGIYFSFSRGGWIVTVGSMFVILPVLLRNRQRQVITFALFVAALIAGLAWELKTHQITRRLEGVAVDHHPFSGLSVRKALWINAYQIWREEPLWGGGPGHFDERFRPYRTRFSQFTPDHAHCDYVEVLADWGAVGAALLLSALVLYLWPLTRHWIKTVLDPTALNAAASNYFALSCGGFAGVLGLLVHSAVDYQLYAPGVMLMFVALVAMLIGQLQGGRWNFSARFPLSVVLIALMIHQGMEASQTVREQHWLGQANVAGSYEERIGDLQRALDVEPKNFQTAYWIGESYRAWSWEGGEDYKRLAEEAMRWFERAGRLNRFDPYPAMRAAMCLDWLKRHEEAEEQIQKALALDPEHYLVLGIAGWHYYQVGDDATARKYLIASHERKWQNNPMRQYLSIVDERLRAKKK
jgi:O-antigen ligase